jgi:exosome complex component RRP45
MVKPPPERPFEGQITIHSEISPMASGEYEQGRCVSFASSGGQSHLMFCDYSPSEEEVTITRMLDKIIRRSDVVDKESLCIQSGQRVLTSPIHVCSHKAEMHRCGIYGSRSTFSRILGICWIVHAWRPSLR